MAPPWIPPSGPGPSTMYGEHGHELDPRHALPPEQPLWSPSSERHETGQPGGGTFSTDADYPRRPAGSSPEERPQHQISSTVPPGWSHPDLRDVPKRNHDETDEWDSEPGVIVSNSKRNHDETDEWDSEPGVIVSNSKRNLYGNLYVAGVKVPAVEGGMGLWFTFTVIITMSHVDF
jgi:hypothetical protein